MDIALAPADARRPRPRHAHRRRNRTEGLQSLADVPVDSRNCWAVLELLIAAFNHQHTLKEKDVSYKTQEDRAKFLRLVFRQLAGLGFHLDPRSLGERHVRALVDFWVSEGYEPKTIQTYLSYLRALSDWIGKQGLVRAAHYYVDNPARVAVSGIAKRDKSWIGSDVDVEAKLAEIALTEPFVAVQLAVMYAFGLRVKETLMLLPHNAVLEAKDTDVVTPTADHYLRVDRGTKGGRRRFVPIDSGDQWIVLELAQAVSLAPDGHLGFPDLPLKQSMKKFRNRMVAHGVTLRDEGIVPHGLRHQFAHECYEEIAGTAPPVHGGALKDKELDTKARLAVSAVLGHRRKQIAGAYLGGILRSIELHGTEQGAVQ